MLHSNPNFTEYVSSSSNSIHLPRSLIRIERNFKVFKFQKFFTISLNITLLNQYKHKRNGSNKIFKLSNPPIFIPSNITPLFSHSHVNYTNRKISRRLYQTPLPFYFIMGTQILQPGFRGLSEGHVAHTIHPVHTHTHTHTYTDARTIRISSNTAAAAFNCLRRAV